LLYERPATTPFLIEHCLYLERIVREGEISPQLSRAAWNALEDIRDVVGPNLEVPDAIPGVDGKLFCTWKRGDHYLELEMLPDGSGEFFYRNAEDGETWSEGYTLGGTLPVKPIAKLHHLQQA
jgi:hypothetical protein